MSRLAVHCDICYKPATVHLCDEHAAETEARTAADAAKIKELYGIPRATLTWACRKGAIVGAEKLGNRWRFPLVTFRAWLRKRKSGG